MSLQHWNSVFQLACGFNTALGAYSSIRQSKEKDIIEELENSKALFDELVASRGEDVRSPKYIRSGLECLKWADLSTFELNAYRRDVATRFWSGYYKRRRTDRICGFVLWNLSIVSVLLLILASIHPDGPMPAFEGIFTSIGLLSPPLLVMVRIAIETGKLNSLIETTDSKEAIKRTRPKRPHSTETPGEIRRVTDQIRRLHRGINRNEKKLNINGE